MSCKKTRAVLEASAVEVTETRSSGKAPLGDADVRTLLAQVNEVIIARGKAARRQPARETSLDDLRGPTGGFRAPMARRGKTLLVGFSEPELRKLFGA